MKSNLWTRFAPALLAAWMSAWVASGAHAYEAMRPRRPHELLLGTKRDVGYRVTTARVVTFNRFALTRDFPYLDGLPNAEIEAWILKHFAYLNEHQVPLTGIRNERISLDRADSADLYAAPGSGRSTDRFVRGGAVNVKADGNTSWNRERVRDLQQMVIENANGLIEAQKLDHRSGLEDHPLSTAEYVRHFEIQENYDRRAARGKSSKQTVEAYFLVDWGFDVWDFGFKRRAFALGRQSHFGRTGRNVPLPGEIYADYGAYQETYSGARVDFGGARTDGEAIEHYQVQVGKLGLDDIPAFIKRELAHIGATPPAPPPAEPSLGDLLRVLRIDRSKLERTPVPEVIGHHRPPVGQSWIVEDHRVAVLKYRLMRIDEAELRTTLDSLYDDELINLFDLSANDFQMPLPRAAYEYGFDRDRDLVRVAALRAAGRVFDRFEGLGERALLTALAHAHDEEPDDSRSEIETMIDVGRDLPGYADFVAEVLRVAPVQAKRTILVGLLNGLGRADVRTLVARWFGTRETDEDLVREANAVFERDLRKSCDVDLAPRFPFVIRRTRVRRQVQAAIGGRNAVGRQQVFEDT